MTDHHNKTSSAWKLVAIAVLIPGLARSWQIADSSTGIDLFHSWCVAILPDSGFPDTAIYDESWHPSITRHINRSVKRRSSERVREWLSGNSERYDTGYCPTGTPFFYSTNRWLTGRDPDRGYLLFQSIATICFVAGCGLIGKGLGLSIWQSLSIAGLAMLFHRGIQSDIGVANVNRIQFGMFALAIWVLQFRRKIHSNRFRDMLLFGLILALLAMYKPNVALAVFFPAAALLVDRQWNWLTGFLTGVLIGVITGFAAATLYFSDVSETWWSWRSYVTTIADQPFDLVSGNYALSRIANDSLVGIVSLLLTVALVTLTTLRIVQTRRRSTEDQATIESTGIQSGRYILFAAVGLVVPLISAPVTWGHYLVLSLPLALMVVLQVRVLDAMTGRQRRRVIFALIGLVLCGLVPASLITGPFAAVITLVSIQIGLGLLLLAGLDSCADHPLSISVNRTKGST